MKALKAVLIQAALKLQVGARAIRAATTRAVFVTKPPVIAAVAASLGFFMGARMHELGFLAQKFGGSLKGATVSISGSCDVNGRPRLPALAEDEVKITRVYSLDGASRIGGVIRKTRELIDCEQSKIAVDTLPLLSKMFSSPVAIPDISPSSLVAKDPEWKKLDQQTLLVSGVCRNAEGKQQDPFTDEQVEVTNVEASKSNLDGFTIKGIKRSDKQAIVCDNTDIRFSFYVKDKKAAVVAEAPAEPTKPKSYIGDTVLVTGICFPDSKIPKFKQRAKVAFYKLFNSKVKVTAEVLDENGKLKKISGAKAPDESSGMAMVECDSTRFSLTIEPYDPDMTKLSNPTKATTVPASTPQGLPDAGTQMDAKENVVPTAAEEAEAPGSGASELSKPVSEGSTK
jgi:hypothetical protein